MKKWLFFAAVLLLFMIVKIGFLYNAALDQHLAEKQEAKKLAMQTYALKAVEDVSYFTGDRTYFVVKGVTKNGQSLYVFVPEKGKPFAKKTEHIAKRHVIQKKLKQLNEVQKLIALHPGVIGQRPVWEAVYISNEDRYVLRYYTLDRGVFIGSYSLKME